jgi:hypothetical protein
MSIPIKYNNEILRQPTVTKCRYCLFNMRVTSASLLVLCKNEATFNSIYYVQFGHSTLPKQPLKLPALSHERTAAPLLHIISSHYTQCGFQVQSTAHQTIHFGTLCRSYFKSISANIELQGYSVTCCWPYTNEVVVWNGIPARVVSYSFLYNEQLSSLVSYSYPFTTQSGVDTTCFSSCCDKHSAIIYTTGRLPDVNPPRN